MIKHLNNVEEFVDVVKNNSKVVVDFNATWCGPCRNMGRVIEDIDDQFDIVFLKVDTDDFPQIAQKFGCMSIPMLVAFKNGERIYFKEEGESHEVILGSRDYDTFHEILEETFR